MSWRAGLKIRLAKCAFAKWNVIFLGNKISENGLAKTQKKVEQLKIVLSPITLEHCAGGWEPSTFFVALF